MVLNIIPGNSFSQKKLFKETNKFFNTSKSSSFITGQNNNYVIHINKKSVKIITSSQFDENDSYKITTYIKTLFKDQSILIDSSEKVSWLNKIKEVRINNLEKRYNRVEK